MGDPSSGAGGPSVSLEALRELFAYSRWAQERILALAEALGPDELGEDMGTSHGSVAGTLVHMMWAEWVWLRRWKGDSPRVMFDPRDYPSVSAIRARWDEIWAEQARFLETLAPSRLAEDLGYVNLKGETWVYPLWREMLHVVNHGTYHRGQVVTLLRQRGKPASATDLLVFHDELRG